MKKERTKIVITGVLLFVAVAAGYYCAKKLITDEKLSDYLSDVIIRVACSAVLVYLIKRTGYDALSFKGITLSSLIVILPVFLVSVNNFPFVSFIRGETGIIRGELILPFALNCVATAIFEELIFRGLFFPWCLSVTGNATKKQVFKAVLISSAVFGLMHLFNIFSSPVSAVLMQVGYTFLLGGAMCFVMLKTGCVWICAFMHAVYNFGGLLYKELGNGFIWSGGQVALTATVAVLCATEILLVLFLGKSPCADFTEQDKR